jgi:DIM1 family U5 snRNP protein
MTVTGWHVDQAIMSEDERLVIIRFGRDWDPDCMRQDEVLYRQSPPLPVFASTKLPQASPTV